MNLSQQKERHVSHSQSTVLTHEYHTHIAELRTHITVKHTIAMRTSTNKQIWCHSSALLPQLSSSGRLNLSGLTKTLLLVAQARQSKRWPLKYRQVSCLVRLQLGVIFLLVLKTILPRHHWEFYCKHKFYKIWRIESFVFPLRWRQRMLALDCKYFVCVCVQTPGRTASNKCRVLTRNDLFVKWTAQATKQGKLSVNQSFRMFYQWDASILVKWRNIVWRGSPSLMNLK